MSNVTKLGLILTFIFTLGCSEQDPLISLISFSSITPKMDTQGPYVVDDSHFSSVYTITGTCSEQVEQIQINTDGNWKSLSEQLPSSETNCDDRSFSVSFTLGQLGFTSANYESKSFSIKTLSGQDESDPIEFVISYQNTLPPTNNATTPTITGITYINNTSVKLDWSLPSDHTNQKLIFNIVNGATASFDCSSGYELILTSQLSGDITLTSGSSGIPSFDLDNNDIQLGVCGVDANSNVSSAAKSFLYKRPQTITASTMQTDTKIMISGISSDGAVGYAVRHVLAGQTLPSCPAAAEFSVDNTTINTGLTANTGYDILICAYNGNSPAQKKSKVINDVFTMKTNTPPTFTLTRSTTDYKISIAPLDTALTYHFDIKTNPNDLVADYNSASDKNKSSISEYPFTVDKNKKYYVRAWVTDPNAYPNTSGYSQESAWSHVELMPRDATNSKLWGYHINNTMPNPHDLSDFTVPCNNTGMSHPNKCVNAGLLWHVEIPGTTACNDYKITVTNTYISTEVPFQWNCVQKSTFGDFQIIGTKESFSLNSLTNLTGFFPLKVELKSKNGIQVLSTNLTNQQLWQNEYITIDSSQAQMLNTAASYNKKVILLTSTHTGPITLDGLSNVTVISKGTNFSTGLGHNIYIKNSNNINFEGNVSNSGTYNPIKIESSKNIQINKSNIHSSEKGVDIFDSEFVQIHNTKVMNITAAAAINSIDSNHLYLNKSKVSNSFGGINFELASTYPKASKLFFSQSSIVGISFVSSAIRIENQSSYPLTTNLGQLTFRENVLESLYLISPKNFLNVNQLFTEGHDETGDGAPDNDALFVSYTDHTASHFYFSQMGFKYHRGNIFLKHNVTAATTPTPKFTNSYLDSNSNATCELENDTGSIGQCGIYSEKVDTFIFGDFFSPGDVVANPGDSDWLSTDIYNFWFATNSMCSSSKTCSLYSTVLHRSASNILDSSKDLTTQGSNNIYNSSGVFTNPENCGQPLTLQAEYRDAEAIKYHLANAAEINTDLIGNNNGFCESNETCILSPNLGAYQGHSPTAEMKVCKMNNSTLNTFNIDVYAYPLNGKF